MKKITINLKSSKIKTKDQAYILKVLAELLEEGFSIKQSIEFIVLLFPKYKVIFQQVINALEAGSPIEEGLKEIGYPISVVAQIFYGQRQGRFIPCLLEISLQMELEQEQKGKFIKVLMYPIFLLFFLGSMLIGMRTFLLPHIISFISPDIYAESFWIRVLIGFFIYMPQLFIGGLGIVGIFIGWFDFYLMDRPAFQRYQVLTKFPIIGKWTRYLATYKLMNELGYFFRGGYSIQQTIQVLVQYPIDPFMSDIGKMLQSGLLAGEDLGTIVSKLGIFTPELPLIIYQGELTSQFAQKCKIYAVKVYNQLIQDIQLKISFVQPILFIFIALLVVSIYMIMMLPMLTMEGV